MLCLTRLSKAMTERLLQPYPAYKPSGINWLGDVPAQWDVRRLRNIGNPACVKTGYEISFTR